MKRKLRFGILLNDYKIPAWYYKMLSEVVSNSQCEIVVFVKNTQEKENLSIFKRLANRRSAFLYVLYRKIDKKLFKPKPDAFEEKDIRNLVKCPEINVKPIKTKFSDRIKDEDVHQIKEYEVDILIRMGFRILRGEILNVARYGIWSYHHGDNRVHRGGPAGFWEVMENWEETGVTLQILSESLDGGIVISRSTSLTDPLSVTRNLNNYYWKSTSMLPRAINSLLKEGEEIFFKKLENQNAVPEFYSAPLYTIPSNLHMAKLLCKLGLRKINSLINNFLFFNQWILLYKIEQESVLSTVFFRFKKIIPPKDRFFADPHLLFRNGKYHIFLEELLYKENRGFISYMEMDTKGKYSKPVKILERNYHLSNPFIMEDNNELYMIPESKQAKNIQLFKCVDFPLKWVFVCNLMEDVEAVDTTILKRDNTYWLFANIVTHKGASVLDELFLFYSDSLEGKWEPHSQNPIVSDVKTARPAGKFFTYKNELYRPSQNCSLRYGYGMKINKVLKLSKEEYAEVTVDSIFPDWDKDIIATHTINHSNGLTMIDANRKRSKYF